MIRLSRVALEVIEPLRALHLQEMNCQIRYDARHWRGWADEYLLSMDGVDVGYGSVAGLVERDARDAVFEFYVIPAYRRQASGLFQALLRKSKAKHVECQSNDPLLSAMLYEFTNAIRSDVVLFADDVVTALPVPVGARFRRFVADEPVFKHKSEPVGDFVIELDGAAVATGGFLRHYNPPFADLYMEVSKDMRRRGLGSLLLQEVKRECYREGRVPAARCSMRNAASRATLLRAGFRVAGFMLAGDVR
jgi:GNAT superfamily N-acetyltransferase